MNSNNKKYSLLEYAVKELKQENNSLKDKIDSISKIEIKKREDLLKLQSSALEAAANGIVITDNNGKINWVNEAFTKLTGYTKEEVYSQNPNVLKSGVHDNNFYNKLWKTVAAGEVWEGEIVNRKKDGALYTEEMTITPLKNDNEEITNYIAIKHDITQRKNTQRNLIINKNSVDESSIGIVWINSESELIYANKSILKNWQYTEDEALKIKVADIDPNWPDKEYFKNKIDLLKQNDGLKFESINKRKDSSLFPVEVSLKLLNYENEEIIVGYIRDISIQVTIREIEKLVIESKSLDELLAGMHNSISKVIPAQNCYLALLDNSTDTVSFPYFIDQHDPPPQPRARKKNFTEYVIKTGKPLRLNKERYTNLIETGEIDAVGTLPISWIGVPLFVKFKSIGALVLQSYDASSVYSDKDLEWLSSISNLIATAIERNIYETKILENEAKFKAITNSTKDAIISVDDKTRIILWNKAAEKLFGFTEEEALGKSTFDLVIPERLREVSEQKFKNVTGIGKDFKGIFNLVAKNKDGAEFEVELSISLTEIGNNWYSTGIWRDLSEKHKLENSSEKEKNKIIRKLKNEITYLRSDNNILNNIIKIIPQRVYAKDLNSTFIKANQATLQEHGFTLEEEILGKKDSDFFSLENSTKFEKEEQEIIKSGTTISGSEREEVEQNGKTAWVQTSKFPLKNIDGKIIGTFGITTELTERKRVEDELRDSHYKFRQLIENSTLGIVRIDEDGEIIMANPAMVKMLEYKSENEVIKLKSVHLYSSLNNRKKFLQILTREGKISGFEDTLIKGNGELIEVRQSAWAVKDNKNKVVYYDIILEDITEQNQVLKILHESEFKYRMLIDKLSEAVYLSVDGKFEIVNSKFLDLFELNEVELYSSEFDLDNYIPKSSLTDIIEKREKSLDKNESTTSFEITITTKSGIEKEVEVSLSYLNYNGKVAAQGVVRDLTKVKKQETQIRHLQKMESIGTLAAGIAHEINTPSQFVSDNLSFLRDSFNEIKPILSALKNLDARPNSSEEFNNLIENTDIEYLQEEIPLAIDQSIDGVDRIAGIVGAMRDFAHTGPKDKVSADIHKIIQNSITLSKNTWKYIAEIETKFADDLPPLVCQANDINQVIVNMLVNSSHALEDKFGDVDDMKGKIEIKTNCTEDHIILEIKDNGLGMPEKVIKRVFDPFYTTKDVGKGTGQGLAIAYDIIVTKHGGDIEVSSEEGVGTQFIIKIPIDQPTIC